MKSNLILAINNGKLHIQHSRHLGTSMAVQFAICHLILPHHDPYDAKDNISDPRACACSVIPRNSTPPHASLTPCCLWYMFMNIFL